MDEARLREIENIPALRGLVVLHELIVTLREARRERDECLASHEYIGGELLKARAEVERLKAKLYKLREYIIEYPKLQDVRAAAEYVIDNDCGFTELRRALDACKEKP